jgi:hypothetical protein
MTSSGDILGFTAPRVLLDEACDLGEIAGEERRTSRKPKASIEPLMMAVAGHSVGRRRSGRFS